MFNPSWIQSWIYLHAYDRWSTKDIYMIENCFIRGHLHSFFPNPHLFQDSLPQWDKSRRNKNKLEAYLSPNVGFWFHALITLFRAAVAEWIQSFSPCLFVKSSLMAELSMVLGSDCQLSDIRRVQLMWSNETPMCQEKEHQSLDQSRLRTNYFRKGSWKETGRPIVGFLKGSDQNLLGFNLHEAGRPPSNLEQRALLCRSFQRLSIHL